MTSIFDRWTELDPALALRRIEAAHGSAIFDRYSYLDSERAIKQIEDALALSLDDVIGVLNFRFLEASIDAALMGGGSPDWVPANAKIFIDLVNNRAWTEANGTVAIDTLLGTDANTENYWGPSGYSGGNDLGPYGLVYNQTPPALIGAALTKVLAGATWRVVLTETVASFGNVYIPVMSADGNDAIFIEVNASDRGIDATSNSGPLSLSIDNIANKGSEGDKNVLVFTLTDARLDMAMNGSSAASGVIGSSDRPSGNPLVATLVDSSAAALSSITIYDALPDTTGLSALSEVTA